MKMFTFGMIFLTRLQHILTPTKLVVSTFEQLLCIVIKITKSFLTYFYNTKMTIYQLYPE